MNEVNEIRNIVYGLTTTLGMQYPELQFRLIDLCNSIDKQLELIQAKIELAVEHISDLVVKIKELEQNNE